MQEIYLDNASTTRVIPPVIEEIKESLKENYGNPSSLHRKGIEAEKKIKNSRQIIANKLNVDAEEIYFTSGGTEANNLAILGSVSSLHRYGNKIITTPVEHPSVKSVMEHLENEGWNVTYLNVDKTGRIELQDLKNKIDEETILVSIIGVNNELGTIQPIRDINRIVSKYKNLHLHIDGVQDFGKTDIFDPGVVDLYSFSGHKIYGPKGVGGLYVGSDTRIENILYGSSQENGLRPGTENVPGIAGLGKAVEVLQDSSEETFQLKKMLRNGIKERIEEIKFNGPKIHQGSPYILNVSFSNLKGEILVHSLEEEGIYVSTGSACHSRDSGPSHVVKSIGVEPEYIEGTVRFSFSDYNTEKEIKTVLNILEDKVNELRQIL